MADRVVLDAHAVPVFLGEEPGWAEVEEILRTGEPWMTLVNLGEVAYILERTSGAAAADEVWANLRAQSRPGGAPVRWIDVDDTLVRRAAAIKVRGGLSYADAFAAGAASLLDCPVLTGDPEFRVAEELGVSVRWLGRRAQPGAGLLPRDVRILGPRRCAGPRSQEMSGSSVATPPCKRPRAGASSGPAKRSAGARDLSRACRLWPR